jgi:hypothetical protein
LVKFAGGHDSGRLARPEDMETDLTGETNETVTTTTTPPQGDPAPQPKAGPWGALKPAIPFGRRGR